jgi:DNA-binding protein HU-beta
MIYTDAVNFRPLPPGIVCGGRPTRIKETIMAGKRMSKAQFINIFAEKTGMNKKQATATLNTLNAMAAEQLALGGEVVIPGLVKLNVAEKPATQERQGINPFTKQPMTFKAKPARRVVKAHPLKALKDAL